MKRSEIKILFISILTKLWQHLLIHCLPKIPVTVLSVFRSKKWRSKPQKCCSWPQLNKISTNHFCCNFFLSVSIYNRIVAAYLALPLPRLQSDKPNHIDIFIICWKSFEIVIKQPDDELQLQQQQRQLKTQNT